MLGWIHEGEIEWRAEPGGLFAQVSGTAPMNTSFSKQAQRVDILSDRAARGVGRFDEEAEACPARDRFKAERAGPGEQINHPSALKLRGPGGVGEHVEQAFTRPVRGRPGRITLWRLYRAAFKLSCNDPHGLPLGRCGAMGKR